MKVFYPIMNLNYSMMKYLGGLVGGVMEKVILPCLFLFHLCFQLQYSYELNGGTKRRRAKSKFSTKCTFYIRDLFFSQKITDP